MRLIVIGSVHLDPRGPELLKTALDRIMPERVTVDVSRYAVQFRKGKGPELLALLEPFRRADGTLPASLEAVEAQISIPFELRAVECWCNIYDKAYYMIGDDGDSAGRLKLFETELMSSENLAFLATQRIGSLASQARRQWAKARAACTGKVSAEPCDEHIAGQLRILAPESGCLMHITGWEHLSPLSALLFDLSPSVKLLDEFSPQRS